MGHNIRAGGLRDCVDRKQASRCESRVKRVSYVRQDAEVYPCGWSLIFLLRCSPIRIQLCAEPVLHFSLFCMGRCISQRKQWPFSAWVAINAWHFGPPCALPKRGPRIHETIL